jgi:hypothetical protein
MDLIEECYTRGWTDGLPVVPPTEERVDRMLGERAHDRDVVVAQLAPSQGAATLERVAANAVMAGCEPHHLPVVTAAVRAVADPRFKLDRVMTTASSQAPMLLVTGPLAQGLGFDGGAEALGSSARANATVGRALQLVLRNVAGLRDGGLPHSTLGHPGHRGFCITENHEISPFDPYHVGRAARTSSGEVRDLTAQDSAVTVYPAESPLCIVDMGRTDPDAVLANLVASVQVPGVYNWFFREDLWLLLSPQHALLFAEAGWTKDVLIERLHAQLRLPADRLRDRGLYGYIDGLIPPVWLDGPERDAVPIVDDIDRIHVAVCGGAFGGYTAVVFGEGESVTVPFAQDPLEGAMASPTIGAEGSGA